MYPKSWLSGALGRRRPAVVWLASLLAALLHFSPAFGQATTAGADVPVPAPTLLWGTQAAKTRDADQPALYAYLPTGNSTGAAVVILPGADATKLHMDNEGAQVAQWLSAHGIAGFVLRYRLPHDDAVADANLAVQYVRAHAADYQINPAHIGTLGLAAGATLQADTAYNYPLAANLTATDPVERVSSAPDFMALVFGAALPTAQTASLPPPTLLIASTGDGPSSDTQFSLWTKLRAARVSVDAHFFTKADIAAGLGQGDPVTGAWPEIFYNWVRVSGFLTEQPRVAIRGMAYLDGRTLPHGYIIFTPVDAVGAGPIIGRVYNSDANTPIGQFSVAARQGPVPGKYKVTVYEVMTRWLSNAFAGTLTPAFGHSRNLEPSIDDYHVYTKVHPNDPTDYTIEIGPQGDQNLNIAVFSGNP